jgi:hypothetical protein
MTPRNRDSRFFALIDLAKSGDASAVHSLWLEYGHDFSRAGDPRDCRLTKPMSETNNKHQKEK